MAQNDRYKRIADAIEASANRRLPSRNNPDDIEFVERLEKALAAYCAGHSMASVAEDYGVERNTVALRVSRHPKLREIHKESLEAAKERAAEHAIALDLEIADEAGRELLARLGDEEKRKKMSVGELNFIRGTNRDKAIKALEKTKPRQPNAYSEILSQLTESGGTVSVTVKPGPKAIDVTPEKEEDRET